MGIIGTDTIKSKPR